MCVCSWGWILHFDIKELGPKVGTKKNKDLECWRIWKIYKLGNIEDSAESQINPPAASAIKGQILSSFDSKRDVNSSTCVHQSKTSQNMKKFLRYCGLYILKEIVHGEFSAAA